MNTLSQSRTARILLLLVTLFVFSSAALVAQSPVMTQFFKGANQTVSGIAADASGNIFAAGGFGVAKVDPDFHLLFQKTIPADVAQANALALDSAGNVYVTGSTTQSWYFVIAGLIQPTLIGCGSSNGCNNNVFLAKFDGNTGDLVWVTYFGGHAADSGTSLAVGADGTIYVAGSTASTDFPITGGALIPAGTSPEGFLARFSQDGKSLISSTYFNGAPQSVTLDALGAVFVTGRTSDSVAGTAGAYQTTTGYVNLMCSLDGGDTWSNLAVPSRIVWVEPDPNNPGELYAATVTGLFRSEDGGGTWADLGGPFRSVVVTQVRVDATDGRTIYVVADTDGFKDSVGTVSNHALWKTSDGGGTWVKLKVLGTAGGLWVNQTHPSTLYLNWPASQTTISTDGGKTWSGLPVPNANGFTADVVNGDLIYLGFSNNLWLARSADAGQHWEYLEDPARNLDSILGSTPLFASGPTLFHASRSFSATAGGVTYTGMRRSKDGGREWWDVPGVPATAAYGDVKDPSRVFTTGPAGLFASPDLGDTWRSLQANVDNPNVTQVAVSADGTLYAVATPQPGAFVAKVAADLSEVSYYTAYGDTGGVTPNVIAVDSNGRAVIAGTTTARNMPLSDGQPGLAGYRDGFVARFGSDGSQLDFARFLGGSANDSVNGLTISANGDIYLAGGTGSADFPVTANALQPQNGASTSAGFIAILGSDGSLKYSTFLSGSYRDSFGPIRLVGDKLYLGGYIWSNDFPGGGSPADGNMTTAAVVQINLRAVGLP